MESATSSAGAGRRGSDAFEFRVLGPLEVVRAGEHVAVPGRRPRALLAVLLLHANEVLSRDRLIDALWGAAPPETAANALQVNVHALRAALGRDRISTRGAGYAIRVEPGELDLERFDALVRRGRELLAGRRAAAARDVLVDALSLWRGRALADQAGEPFAAAAAGALDDARLAAVEARLEADLALGRHDDLVAELESLVADHPFRERLRALLMLALYRAGRQKDALQAYARARAQLVDELGVEPGPALRRLESQILRQDAALDPPAAPTRLGGVALPAPATALVGRDGELAAATALLREPGVRLLTLTGIGGTGKTRLALAVAEELRGDLADGVRFADLAPVHDPGLVPAVVARAVGVGETPGRSLARALEDALADRAVLVVIDNFEHVLAAAGAVASLLAAAPRLKVLATSREALRVAAEHEFPVAPLELPAPGAAADPAVLGRSAAVALFVARARTVRPGFALTEDNGHATARICTALDGLPLALELAAARMKMLTPDALLERLGAGVEALGTGPRDAPARQRTLRSTIDWSYRLLDAPQQTLFARAAVFRGSWTLAAAEAVCGADVEAVAALVDKSLVRRRDGEAEPRFAMLDTVREYALERLHASGEAAAVRARHAEHFVELAERIGPRLREHESLAAVEAEYDNLRAVLDPPSHPGAADLQLRLCAAIWRFWYVRGRLSEGRAHLERALQDDTGALPGRRADVLRGIAVLALVQGDHAAAARCADESLALYRSLGDDGGAMGALISRGLIAQDLGDLDGAAVDHAESRAIARRLGRTREEGAAVANLGDIAFMQGAYGSARALYEESLGLCRAAADTPGVAIAVMSLAIVALRSGEGADAAARGFGEALALFDELGFKERVASCLAGLAAATSPRDGEGAARLLGAADALRAQTGARPEPWWEEPMLAEAGASLRTRLGGDAFARAFEQGRRASTASSLDVIRSR
jgi:predicted ATPase/DNA-binding SARP family transcriptional activator